MDFKPTQEMLEAIEKVKKCKEIVNAIRVIVLKYKTEILNEMHAEPDDNISKYIDLPGVILDPKDVWALKKADLAFYDTLCRMERDKHGIAVEDDRNCPLLEAEYKTIEAQLSLIKILEQMTCIPIREVIAAGLDRYMEYVYLALKQLES